MDGDSIRTKFVGDSEGGFWISLDDKSVARAIETAGGVGCRGRTRDVYFGCVPTEAAKSGEVSSARLSKARGHQRAGCAGEWEMRV